jgi:hypothetical protein
MTTNTHLPLAAYLGMAALIGWRIYKRVRSLVGRQRLTAWRPWISVCLFPLLIIGLFVGLASHPARVLPELAGVVLGIGLAFYSLRLTRFENTPAGLYYTPNAHIGIVLSLLLVARLGYRLVQSYLATNAFTAPPVSLLRSPLTVFIVGLLAGYYAAYAFGLLRWRHKLQRSAVPAPAADEPA